MSKAVFLNSLLLKNSKIISNTGKYFSNTANSSTESSVTSSSAGKKLYFRLPSKQIPAAHYAGRHTVSLISGDGVGPELLNYLKLVFKHLNSHIYFEELVINKDSSDKDLDEAILSLKRNGVGIKGNLVTKENGISKNVSIRKELALNVYLQRCFTFPGVETRHDKVDIAIVRENSEGEYSRLEHENIPGVVESLKIVTRNKCEKIARFAFDYAIEHNRRKVTCVHKANIMKLGDGLFLDTCRRISKEYPNIEFDSIIIDNCCMQLVSRPEQFDVMVMPNLYGNIVGNVSAGLIGGPGLTAGVNLSSFNDVALFEMGTRNSGESIVGKNIANPTCILLAGANMLEYLGHVDHGRLLRLAVFDTTKRQRLLTADIGGNVTTSQFVDGVLKYINENGNNVV